MQDLKDRADATVVSEKDIEAIRKAFGNIKNLKEEKKSIEESIRDIKITLSKKIGFSVKDINNIMKVYDSREKGELDDEVLKIIRCLEGTLSPEDIGPVHMGGDNDCFGSEDENEPDGETEE
jgi:uncharacterized protein (UPF0335 family)